MVASRSAQRLLQLSGAAISSHASPLEDGEKRKSNQDGLGPLGLPDGTSAVVDALRTLSSEDLLEVRKLHHPPWPVRCALEVTCLILEAGQKPISKPIPPSWASVQKMLSNENFLHRVLTFDVAALQASPALVAFVSSEYFGSNAGNSRKRSKPSMMPAHNSNKHHRHSASALDELKEPLTVARVARASKSCGELLRWCEAVLASSEENGMVPSSSIRLINNDAEATHTLPPSAASPIRHQSAMERPTREQALSPMVHHDYARSKFKASSALEVGAPAGALPSVPDAHHALPVKGAKAAGLHRAMPARHGAGDVELPRLPAAPGSKARAASPAQTKSRNGKDASLPSTAVESGPAAPMDAADQDPQQLSVPVPPARRVGGVHLAPMPTCPSTASRTAVAGSTCVDSPEQLPVLMRSSSSSSSSAASQCTTSSRTRPLAALRSRDASDALHHSGNDQPWPDNGSNSLHHPDPPAHSGPPHLVNSTPATSTVGEAPPGLTSAKEGLHFDAFVHFPRGSYRIEWQQEVTLQTVSGALSMRDKLHLELVGCPEDAEDPEVAARRLRATAQYFTYQDLKCNASVHHGSHPVGCAGGVLCQIFLDRDPELKEHLMERFRASCGKAKADLRSATPRTIEMADWLEEYFERQF